MRNLMRGGTSYTLLGLDVRLLGVLSTMGEPISYQRGGGHTIRYADVRPVIKPYNPVSRKQSITWEKEDWN